MRERSKSLTLPGNQLPISQREETIFKTVHEPIPLQPVDHPFTLQVKHSEKGTSNPITAQRMRSNSFDTTIKAFQDTQEVGGLHMTTHRNQQPVDFQNRDNVGKLVQGKTTSYIDRIDNFTFDGFNKGVSGVGKTLMSEAEKWAQFSEAEKISLTPAPTTYTRNVQKEVPNTGMFSFLKPTKMVTQQESKTYDPTGFYQHVGYGKDPIQKEAQRNEAAQINTILAQGNHQPIDVEEYADTRTALLSKPLFQDVQRKRSNSLPPPPKKPF